MPLIEVLPNTSAVSAPGWAYVPDTGWDPSKAPLQPSGARQRAARNVAVGNSQEVSVRQQNAITKHLAELDRDNYKDVQIAIPTRQRDGPGGGGERILLQALLSSYHSKLIGHRHSREDDHSRSANSSVAKDIRQSPG